MRITPAMIQEWHECPKRFMFRHIEKEVRPPMLQPLWESSVLRGLLTAMKVKEEEDRLMDLEEMVQVVIQGYTSKVDLLERPPRKGKMDSYFAHATTICQEFLTRDMAIITPSRVGQMHETVIPSGPRGIELAAPVHVIDGSQIGMLFVQQYKMRERMVLAHPSLICAALASGIDHYWFLTISVRKGAAFSKYHGYITEGMKRWYKQIIVELAPLMEEGPYPPGAPGVWWCTRRACQYWIDCRGVYEARARVIRS